jgi:hypothetical protein
MLAQADPVRAKLLAKKAQADADARWTLYEQIAGVHRTVTEQELAPAATDPSAAGAAPATTTAAKEGEQ